MYAVTFLVPSLWFLESIVVQYVYLVVSVDTLHKVRVLCIGLVMCWRRGECRGEGREVGVFAAFWVFRKGYVLY